MCVHIQQQFSIHCVYRSLIVKVLVLDPIDIVDIVDSRLVLVASVVSLISGVSDISCTSSCVSAIKSSMTISSTPSGCRAKWISSLGIIRLRILDQIFHF